MLYCLLCYCSLASANGNTSFESKFQQILSTRAAQLPMSPETRRQAIAGAKLECV
jgi:hypothetical protein